MLENAQYSRRECVEVVGLPSSIEDKDLEPTVCRVLQHIGVGIKGEGIEACHRLNKKSDRTSLSFQGGSIVNMSCEKKVN